MAKAPRFFVETAELALPRRAAREYLESTRKLPAVLYPTIRVLTANKATQNKTFYPLESLVGDPDQGTGLISFVRPYPIPIIRDHITTPGMMGGYASDVYGRVLDMPSIGEEAGVSFIQAAPAITHPEAIEAVLDGRWLTVSLGSRVSTVFCSICGADLTDEEAAAGCEHEKGDLYDTPMGRQEALWEIGPIRAKEISFVVTPSDDEARVLDPVDPALLDRGATESAAGFLIGNEAGIFDLATGRSIAAPATPLRRRGPWRGFSLSGLKGRVAEARAAADPPPSTAPRLAQQAPGDRKGPRMTESETPATHAAQLVDQAHSVQVFLYPFPTDAEALAQVERQIAAMPHTEAERTQIQGRIAIACQGWMEASAWQQAFGALEGAAAGEPVVIPVGSDNYALLYAASELEAPAPAAPASTAPIGFLGEPETLPTEPTETPTATETETPTEAAVPPTETPTETETEPGADPGTDPASTEAEVAETATDPATTEAEVTPELEEAAVNPEAPKVKALETIAREALAHTVALYMRSLRKVAARGKSQLELVQSLSQRTIESLNDSMNDLALEWDHCETAEVTRLPILTDPTAPETAGPVEGRPATAAEEAAAAITAPTLTSVAELPLEGPEPETITVKTSNFLLELFPNLNA